MLAERLRLPFAILEPLIERMRAERLIEVRGATGTSAASYRYALTDLGRDRARAVSRDQPVHRRRRRCRSPATSKQMRALAASRGFIDRERLRSGFAHLIVGDADPRAARSGGQRQQGHLSVRPSGQRQDRDRRRPGPRRSAATCTCRTPSTSRATSSRCSTRSATSRSKTRGEPVERHRRGAQGIGAGCASAVRS